METPTIWQATIIADKTTRTITERSLDKIIVDTTVQPKAVEHPTDARQYRKVPELFVAKSTSSGNPKKQRETAISVS